MKRRETYEKRERDRRMEETGTGRYRDVNEIVFLRDSFRIGRKRVQPIKMYYCGGYTLKTNGSNTYLKSGRVEKRSFNRRVTVGFELYIVFRIVGYILRD